MKMMTRLGRNMSKAERGLIGECILTDGRPSWEYTADLIEMEAIRSVTDSRADSRGGL